MLSMRKQLAPLRLSTRTAALAALLALGPFAAHAQEAGTQPEQPAQAAEQPTTPAGAQPSASAVPQPEWEKVCGDIRDQRECHTSRRRVAATGQALAQFMIIERGDKKLVQVAVPPVA